MWAKSTSAGTGPGASIRSSRLLTYMNTAILPWYVLHQTITILLAWHLSRLGIPVGLEGILVVAGTLGGCVLGYEIIRRFTLFRFLFGLKVEGKAPRAAAYSPLRARP